MPADAEGENRLILNDDGAVVMAKTWKPHWATCPKAHEFKKGKK